MNVACSRLWCVAGKLLAFSIPTCATQTFHATLHPSLLDRTHCMLAPADNLWNTDKVSILRNNLQNILAARQRGTSLQQGCTCNIESTAAYYWHWIYSSFALHHCPIQSGCSSECQGWGEISRIAIELVMLVRVATKLNSAHCTAAKLLQSKLVPVIAAVENRTGSMSLMNGSTIHSRRVPCVTVQV